MGLCRLEPSCSLLCVYGDPLEKVSHSQGPHPDRELQPPRYLVPKQHSKLQAVQETTQSIEDDLLLPMMESSYRGEALLDLLCTNVEELIKGVKTGVRPGCSSHALEGFSILRDTAGWVKSRVRTLNLRKEIFQLFGALVQGISWETALRDTEVNKSWQILKDIFLRLLERSVSVCKKLCRGSRRPACQIPLRQTKRQN